MNIGIKIIKMKDNISQWFVIIHPLNVSDNSITIVTSSNTAFSGLTTECSSQATALETTLFSSLATLLGIATCLFLQTVFRLRSLCMCRQSSNQTTRKILLESGVASNPFLMISEMCFLIANQGPYSQHQLDHGNINLKVKPLIFIKNFYQNYFQVYIPMIKLVLGIWSLVRDQEAHLWNHIEN